MKDYFNDIAKKYNTTYDNVISIAINRYGIIIDNYEDNRIRFNLKLDDSDISNFYAVCVNTYKDTPFKLVGNSLYLENEKIGKLSNIEKDTCTSTYFRNNKKVITFNSNSRSQCVGCKFCGTYNLTDDDHVDFSTKRNIKKYFNKLFEENNINGFKDIENVTVCTGCFLNEEKLKRHLLLLNETFKEDSFNGSINYIGSQIRNFDNIKELKDKIGDFGIYLTLEKFVDREKYMRPEKASLTLEDAKKLLSFCSDIGVTSTFLYILGLEDLDVVKKYFNYFKDSINKFPIVQVFQNYTTYQENYRCEEAKDIEYYFKAKELINNIFEDKNISPKLWECFRSLYTKEDSKKLIKCQNKR